jgi:hypothetical protein
MPLSIWLGLEDCLQVITSRRPQSVLDAGIGFGLWGHLLRQYLDVWSGRIWPEQWTTRIDGIEIDPARVQPHARHLYNNIFIGDIRQIVPQCASENSYDIILFGDVLEHLPKDDAFSLLTTATQLARELVVIRLPLGNGWRKEGREPPDHHRSQWSLDDFVSCPATIRLYDFFGNPYALITIETGVPQKQTVADLLYEMEQRLEKIEARLVGIMEADGPNERFTP